MNTHEAPAEYRPEKVRYLRSAVKTLLILLISHAVSWLLYILFISNSMDPNGLPDEVVSRLAWGLFWYAALMLVITGIVCFGFYFKDSARKREFLAATSAEIRGAQNVAEGVTRYRMIALKESLVCTLSAGILWLIPTLFYTLSVATSGMGYGYTEAWALEEFFIGFIGLCEPFKNAWLGLLLGLGVLFAFHYVGRLYSHRTWQKNRIRQ